MSQTGTYLLRELVKSPSRGAAAGKSFAVEVMIAPRGTGAEMLPGYLLKNSCNDGPALRLWLLRSMRQRNSGQVSWFSLRQ